MSYQVLARKWRPRTFHELVGQEHVQRALVNALDQGRLHHAYLFTGTRGVGKTTLARILAKCLNCTAKGEGESAVTSTPCGQCQNCTAIDEGRFVDLIEVDAASRTKVEDTRELLDNVQYAPTQGRFKVYLIDEVHMLSTHSFNALLKTLEEPPPHVKFLLATTDPQKLPVTVLSRCLQFTLKNMPPERIVEHLSHVLGAEGVAFDESALWLLGKAADGSMRDAMSLTDQAIAFGQGEVRHRDVAAMLGTLDHRHLMALVEALAEVDAARVLSEVASLAEQGPDFAGVLDDLSGVLHRLAIAQMVPDALDNGHGDRETLLALAARFTAEDVQLYYQIGLQGRGDMEHAPDARTALEMTLLRMLAFRPQGVPKPAQTPLPLRATPEIATSDSVSSTSSASAGQGAPTQDTPSQDSSAQLPAEPEPEPEPQDAQAERTTAYETGPAETPAGQAPDTEWQAPDESVGYEPPPPWEPQEEIEPASAVRIDPPSPSRDMVRPDQDSGDLAIAEPVEAETVEAEVVSAQSSPAAGFDHAAWLALFTRLELGGLTRNLAAHCTVDHDDGQRLCLRLDPSQSAMNADVHVERIQKALDVAGVTRRLEIVVADLPPGLETPKAMADRLAAARHAQAVEALQDDPHIQKLQNAFGARLIEGTVTPQD
ncbi:DNA polymerase III subunit gamma/tau [Litchfieldella xinjiangensis]|uniref:DNA polymerase III subunit gamma/tau n=1 Tax=Litchfieldella xinjiangensis TaxID=1166948 RepID=UPI0005B9EB48|nr:DNA polymerase III subunit gamma/tau [Halomonas xinjiangensis]